MPVPELWREKMSADYIKDKKILLVDDEPELREMVVSILKEDGFRMLKQRGVSEKQLKQRKR